jgi:hypothetical protein
MTCQATRKPNIPPLPALKCWAQGDHIFHYDIRYQVWWLEHDSEETGVPVVPTLPILEMSAA